jgi:Ras-related protein Rab-1A
MDNNYEHLLKIVIIGNTSVGKSAILRRFCDDSYLDTHVSTIGVDFRVKTININENILNPVKLQIWDTSGQERFKTITSSYYRGSHGIIVVYDITDRESFNDVNRWISELTKIVSDKSVLILVGSKTDIPYNRVISYNEGKELANFYGISFIEVSSFKNVNINEIFKQLVNDINTKIKFTSRPLSNRHIRLNQQKNMKISPPCCSFN